MNAESWIAETLGAYPEITAVLILVLGLVMARLAAGAVEPLLRLVNRFAARLTIGHRDLIPERARQLMRATVLWLLIVFAVMLSLRVLGIAHLSRWLDRILAFLPQAIVAAIIVATGVVLGLLAHNVLRRLQHDRDAVVPRLVQAGIVAIAVVTALQHLGLNVSFLTDLVLILLAVFLGGLALAFALGARQLVANLSARGELARYAPGERIRIDGNDGTIVEVHRTGLVLATDEGLVSVPAARFAETSVVRYTQARGHD